VGIWLPSFSELFFQEVEGSYTPEGRRQNTEDPSGVQLQDHSTGQAGDSRKREQGARRKVYGTKETQGKTWNNGKNERRILDTRYWILVESEERIKARKVLQKHPCPFSCFPDFVLSW